MTTQQDPFAAEFGDLRGPTHWPSLLPEDAGQSWAELREWVEQLVDRFGLETRVIPPCWYKHSALVEPLSALRDFERISFAPNASPTAAVDWLRALREVEHHLSQACARTQCSINEHRPDPPAHLANRSRPVANLRRGRRPPPRTAGPQRGTRSQLSTAIGWTTTSTVAARRSYYWKARGR